MFLRDNMPNIVFRVNMPEGLLFGCMEFGWVVGWVGSWVQSFHFTMGWVGLVLWVGLGWINWTHGQLWVGRRSISLVMTNCPPGGRGQRHVAS